MYTEWIRIAAVLAAAAVIGGCAAGRGYHGHAEVPAGSLVELHQTLSLPAATPARVYLQGGQVIPRGAVNEFEPFCSFGLRRQGDEALVGEIRPGSFRVVRDSRSWHRPGAGIAGAMLVAGTEMFPFREDRGPARFTFYTELPLESAAQPQVDDLRCQFDGDRWHLVQRSYPGAAHSRQALGGIASLDLAARREPSD